VWIPVIEDGADEPPFDPASLDMSPWFPCGYRSARIRTVPGTTYELTNKYRLFVTSDEMSSPVNSTIRNMYGRIWYGNIVVIKLGKVFYERIVHVGASEMLLTDVVLGM